MMDLLRNVLYALPGGVIGGAVWFEVLYIYNRWRYPDA